MAQDAPGGDARGTAPTHTDMDAIAAECVRLPRHDDDRSRAKAVRMLFQRVSTALSTSSAKRVEAWLRGWREDGAVLRLALPYEPLVRHTVASADRTVYVGLTLLHMVAMLGLRLGVKQSTDASLAEPVRKRMTDAEQDFAARVRILVDEFGIPVDVTDLAGRTPLHHAIMTSSTFACVALLRAGASMHAADAAGQTGFEYVAWYFGKQHMTEGNEVLAEAARLGASRTRAVAPWRGWQTDVDNRNAAACAARPYTDGAEVDVSKVMYRLQVLMGSKSLIETLREWKESGTLSFPPEFGEAGLSMAWPFEQLAQLRLSTNVVDADSAASFLHYWAIKQPCFVETARLLIESGLHVNVRDLLGRTPLHKAAATPALHSVGLLICLGGDLLATDKAGQTPLDYINELHGGVALPLSRPLGAAAPGEDVTAPRPAAPSLLRDVASPVSVRRTAHVVLLLLPSFSRGSGAGEGLHPLGPAQPRVEVHSLRVPPSRVDTHDAASPVTLVKGLDAKDSRCAVDPASGLVPVAYVGPVEDRKAAVAVRNAWGSAMRARGPDGSVAFRWGVAEMRADDADRVSSTTLPRLLSPTKQSPQQPRSTGGAGTEAARRSRMWPLIAACRGWDAQCSECRSRPIVGSLWLSRRRKPAASSHAPNRGNLLLMGGRPQKVVCARCLPADDVDSYDEWAPQCGHCGSGEPKFRCKGSDDCIMLCEGCLRYSEHEAAEGHTLSTTCSNCGDTATAVCVKSSAGSWCGELVCDGCAESHAARHGKANQNAIEDVCGVCHQQVATHACGKCAASGRALLLCCGCAETRPHDVAHGAGTSQAVSGLVEELKRPFLAFCPKWVRPKKEKLDAGDRAAPSDVRGRPYLGRGSPAKRVTFRLRGTPPGGPGAPRGAGGAGGAGSAVGAAAGPGGVAKALSFGASEGKGREDAQ